MNRLDKGKTKKAMAALMAAAMLFATGCGGEEKVIDGSVQNIHADAGGDTGDAEQGQVQAAGDGSAEHAGAKGYVFTVGGITVEMDADAAPIVEGLGEPVSYFEAASCAFEGLDKMYTYNGFELDTYPKGEKDYVSTVILKDDTVLTPEGIGIGDSLADLRQAYPDGGTEEDGMLVYEKGGMKLCFILKDDAIVSIEYRSTVLD